MTAEPAELWNGRRGNRHVIHYSKLLDQWHVIDTYRDAIVSTHDTRRQARAARDALDADAESRQPTRTVAVRFRAEELAALDAAADAAAVDRSTLVRRALSLYLTNLRPTR